MYSPEINPNRSESVQRSFGSSDVFSAVTNKVRAGATFLEGVKRDVRDVVDFLGPNSTWDSAGVAESGVDSCVRTTDGGVHRGQRHAEGLVTRVAKGIGRVLGSVGIGSPAGRSAQSARPTYKPERYL